MDESSRLDKNTHWVSLSRRSAQDQWSCALSGLSVAGILWLVGGCLGDNGTANQTSATGNHAPIIKALSILPTPAILAAPLTVRVEAQDLDSETIKFRYRWFVNGQVISGQTGETLPPAVLKRGDQVSVEVIPFDGRTDGSPYVSAPVPIVNTAPILSSLSVDFDHAAQGRQLRANAEVFDPDDDAVSLTYRWRKNETVVQEGEASTLSVVGLTSRDMVEVDVTASDGNTNGTTTLSGRFTMSNSSPTILSSPSVSTTGDVYEYLVQASDPDGDPLTYTLEEAPPGMSIGEQSGRIHWSVTPEAKGIYRIKVVAQDNKGGYAAQAFELSIATPPKAS